MGLIFSGCKSRYFSRTQSAGKTAAFFLAGILLLISPGLNAHAESAAEFDYGRQQIEQAVPQDTRDALSDSGIDPENGGVLGLQFSDVLNKLLLLIKERAAAPLKLLAALVGVVLLCALCKSMTDGSSKSLQSVFSAVCVLSGAGIALTAISSAMRDALSILSEGASFMLAFIPVFTAITAVLGHPAAATAANATTLCATQIFSQLAVNFLAPLCGTIMGLSAAGAVYPKLNLGKLGELVKKFVVWGLSLMMTVFISLLSAQTFVANASDSALTRATKFMVSSGVPIVGGTISDAVNTVQGGLVMLKSSVGTYGMAAAVFIILPTLITAVCYKLAMSCASAASEMFGLEELSGLYKSCDSAMAIILAVISCFLLLNIIAVVIMLAMSGAS